jgi:hypothetical protein
MLLLADEVIEWGRDLLRCMSPVMALNCRDGGRLPWQLSGESGHWQPRSIDDDPAMGFNKPKMEDRRRQAAEQEAAARRATEKQILEDADNLIAVWNERQVKRMPMLFSPSRPDRRPWPVHPAG